MAAAVVGGLVHRVQVPAPTLYGHALLAAVVVEMLFTFALCYVVLNVVLNVATSRDHPDNSSCSWTTGPPSSPGLPGRWTVPLRDK